MAYIKILRIGFLVCPEDFCRCGELGMYEIGNV